MIEESKEPQTLEAGHHRMPEDEQREAEVLEWAEALVGDVQDEVR
jgi:hypothetical protein